MVSCRGAWRGRALQCGKDVSAKRVESRVHVEVGVR